jgi:hypothetical protein
MVSHRAGILRLLASYLWWVIVWSGGLSSGVIFRIEAIFPNDGVNQDRPVVEGGNVSRRNGCTAHPASIAAPHLPGTIHRPGLVTVMVKEGGSGC